MRTYIVDMENVKTYGTGAWVILARDRKEALEKFNKYSRITSATEAEGIRIQTLNNLIFNEDGVCEITFYHE